MESPGLRYGDLKTLVTYRLLTPGSYFRNLPTFLTGTLLLVSLAANLASPIVTGVISWVPNNRLAHGLRPNPPNPLQIRGADEETPATALRQYRSIYLTATNEPNAPILETAAMIGLGVAGSRWGRAPEKGVLKRFALSVDALALNSTVQNVTIPFFEIHSLEWITSIENNPIITYYSSPDNMIKAAINASSAQLSIYPPGLVILVPNTTTDWIGNTPDSTTILNTRLLLLSIDENSSVAQNLPPNTYIWPEDINSRSFAYAWVTFSAGVGQCATYNCVYSSPASIQNNTPIALEPHVLSERALALAQAIGVNLVTQGASLPPYSNINEYVEAILVRSYSGAWEGLNEFLSSSSSNTSYIPTYPALLAQVNTTRVYIWLGIQLLVTLLSALVMTTQFRESRYPVVDDPALAAFYLDATDIPISSDAAPFKEGKMLKVVPQGDRLKVKIE
ncbi:unnamed protein product [Rhizoctonia solani]|uniref:Uncharacterized protein n=1 Tax=Rhizoctonia solani TaxID=456999 RepID=A0A8H3C0T2_9AGAM|nr:unnamed protein product [Rhizoctonia solani]